jgi:hypothetical protein
MKKTIYTLNLNKKEYEPITELTYPWLKFYAFKIGAEFKEITERKFPEWPITYEKLQLFEIAQRDENDWNIFMDCDTLVHPDTFDFSTHVPKDTVMHNGADMATMRWRYDRFFMRDGRHIGSPTWNCWASDWCVELFKPLDDLTPEQAAANIFPLHGEIENGIKPPRLIEDYVMSRNIAKYGLKFTTIQEMLQKLNMLPWADFFWHAYMMPIDEKVIRMKDKLKAWRLI